MAKRKRPSTPPATTSSAKEAREDRASRRAAAQDIRDQARRDQITTLNAVNSPLLRLPTEIRNIVFAHVYTDKWLFLHKRGHLTLPRYKGYNEGLVSLSFVCRQTEAEASLLPYELGMFDFWAHLACGLEELCTLKKFLGKRSAVPGQIDAMAVLKFTQWSVSMNDHWHQTRTGAHWEAKLKDLAVSVAKMGSYDRMLFDVSSLGPSD